MQQVNVLAVLADLVADMGDAPGTTGELVERARAAVAELIEADKRIDFTPLDDLPDDASCVITVSAGDLRRRAAALANVTGGGK